MDRSIAAVLTPPQQASFARIVGLGTGERLRADHHGWYKHALIGPARVFLFPRNHLAVPGLEHEIAVYEHFAGSGIRIGPRLLGRWDDPSVSPYPFAAVTRLRGRRLSDFQDRLDEGGWVVILAAIGRAIAQWHSLDTGRVPAALQAPPDEDWTRAWLGPDGGTRAEALERITRADGRFSDAQRVWTEALERLTDLDPVFTHGDVHEGQVLFRAGKRPTVTGVIDWTTAATAHPLRDFDLGEWGTGIWRHRPSFGSFLTAMWESYRSERGVPLPASEDVGLLWALARATSLLRRAEEGLPAWPPAGTAAQALDGLATATQQVRGSGRNFPGVLDRLPTAIPGIELSRRMHAEVVRPILIDAEPDLHYAAALIGPGSEVLGFDDHQSTDHDWGPRLLILLNRDSSGVADRLRAALDAQLPETFVGYSLASRGQPPFSAEPGPHRVRVIEAGEYLREQIGFDPSDGVEVDDWLLAPSQLLLEVTAGAVFHDEISFERIRARLAWYPQDVWLYLLACQWNRIAQEAAFPGRAAMVGDELGARVVTARLVRDLMRLAFLIERRYAPYSKWLGSAFDRLTCAPALGPALRRALDARQAAEREDALVEACETAGALQNRLGLIPPIAARRRPYFSRPFEVVDAGLIAHALSAAIEDPEIRALDGLVGSVDQFTDSVDVLSTPRRLHRLGAMLRDS